MTTIRASKIQEALRKAQNIGLIEDEFTLMGMKLVLRNMRPNELEAIVQEVEGLDDAEYLFEFQKSHICRALLQINEVDLRGVEFIEDEAPSGAWIVEVLAPDESTAKQVKDSALTSRCQATIKPPTGEPREVSLELHEWVRRNVVNTWSREIISTSYRKFAENLVKADEEATKGVTFTIPDETIEEKARRLIAELKEVEVEAQKEMFANILDEAGYAHKSAREKEDAQAAVERLDKVVPQAAETTPDPQQLMRDRQPLNRAAPPPEEVQPPAPPQPQPNQMVPTGPGAPPAQVAPPTSMAVRSKRSEEIAAQEDAVGVGAPVPEAVQPPDPNRPRPRRPAAEIRPIPVNPQEVRNILDQPPTGGLNPKWKPPAT